MEKTLSQRIAARVMMQPSPSRCHHNRAVFLELRDEVRHALEDGWSILAVYRILLDDRRLGFGYQAFRRYVNTLIALETNERGPADG